LEENKTNKSGLIFKSTIVVLAVLAIAWIATVTVIDKNEKKRAAYEEELNQVLASTGDSYNTDTTASIDNPLAIDTETTGSATAAVYTLTVDNVDDCIVKFGNYKGLTVSDLEPYEPVTDEEAEYYAEYYFYPSDAAVLTSDVVAKEGDTVVINYVGTIDGVAFNGGTADGQELTLGSNSYIAGFEDGLIGAVPGETRELNLTFPETYGNTDLAGKDCVFTVTVTGIKLAFSDEGVAAIGLAEASNVKEYVAATKEILEEYYTEQYKNSIAGALLDMIIADSEFNAIPEELLEYERQEVYAAYYEDAYSYGLDVDTYLSYMSVSVDEIAESYAKQLIVFTKIGKEEGLSPSNAELVAYFTPMLDGSGYSTAEEYINTVGLEAANGQYMTAKAIDYLVAVNSVE